MNVTFGIDFQPSDTYRFYCYTQTGDKPYGPYPDLPSTEEAIAEHVLTCTECSEYGTPLAVEIPDVEGEVTIPAEQARALLVLLGIRPPHDMADYKGQMRPDDILGRTLIALAFPKDIRMPGSYASRGNLFTLARQRTEEDLLLEENISDLADLATVALTMGRSIEWW